MGPGWGSLRNTHQCSTVWRQMQRFLCSEWGGLTAEQIIGQPQCWNDSSVSIIIHHPRYSMSSLGGSSSLVPETLDSMPKGQTKRKAALRIQGRIVCVSESKLLPDCLIPLLHADYCSEFHDGFLGYRELPVLGMVTDEINAGIQKVIYLILSFLSSPGFFSKILTSYISPLKERN